MKQKNLVLITGLALVLVMTFSIVSAGWFTGKAVDWSTKIYKGNTRTIPTTEDKIKIVSVESNSAFISINGEEVEIQEGATEIVGGYSVYVEEVGKTLFSYWAKVNVNKIGESGEEELSSEEEAYFQEFETIIAQKIPSNLANDLIYRIIEKTSKGDTLLTYRGSSWYCSEKFGNSAGHFSRIAFTGPRPEDGAQPSQYIDANVIGIRCVYIEEHEETGKPEFIAVTISEYNDLDYSNNMYTVNRGAEDDFRTINLITGEDVTSRTSYLKFRTE
jgi:hypothetical protein